ncbi:MAG TPA: hypothetical protein VG816_15240, partial [Solirubrobacterales bacterium]|nr:hypothetical protein [Solirubrobacterales bacterium]
PGPALQSLWREYIRCACATLSPQERMALKAEMLQRAMAVAEAAGGVLGRASSVSSTEAAVLSELDRAFDLLSWAARPGSPTDPDAARSSS